MRSESSNTSLRSETTTWNLVAYLTRSPEANAKPRLRMHFAGRRAVSNGRELFGRLRLRRVDETAAPSPESDISPSRNLAASGCLAAGQRRVSSYVED